MYQKVDKDLTFRYIRGRIQDMVLGWSEGKILFVMVYLIKKLLIITI